MSNVARVAGQAANTLVKPLNVEDVFSTYLYEGESSGTTNTITNGIDLSGEGGLLWLKSRGSGGSDTYGHYLFDTERGANNYLYSQNTDAQNNQAFGIQFNSDGWQSGGGYDAISNSDTSFGSPYASWTFRKAPKFFDVVTYTGDGVGGRTISHNLGSVPGMIIVKQTSSVSNWPVYHRSLGSSAYINLNSSDAKTSNFTRWYGTDPTSTDFTVGVTNVNKLNETYVAYLFAHNDGDGEFGGEADADIIKCGSWTTAGTGSPEVNLGFEPQWIMFKRTDGTGDWRIYDTMRGWLGSDQASNAQWLKPNTSAAESTLSNSLYVTPTGFVSTGIGSGTDYIYIAIRRGPMAVPTDATDVFAIDTFGGTAPTPPAFISGFPVDFAIRYFTGTDSNYTQSRLTGETFLQTNSTSAEVSSSPRKFDYMDGYYDSTGTNTGLVSPMWKRAPNYFDVVAYTGNGTVNHQISHNLQAVPELLLFKPRGSGSWIVKSKFDDDASGVSTRNNYLLLNYINAYSTSADYRLSSNETSFTLSTNGGFDNGSDWNTSGLNYIAYLFASLDGVSKVGSFTHTDGTPTDVNCGFTSGARFVLWKKATGVGQWVVVDTERGIVAGNDPYLELNSTIAENSSYDIIDPLSSGFTVGSVMSSGTYIFYAIA